MALGNSRQHLVELLRARQVATSEDMKVLLRGFVERARQDLTTAMSGQGLPGPTPVVQLSRGAFQQLDQANLYIAGDLRIRWEELSGREREILGADLHVAPEELARLQASATGLAWREMSTLRRAWMEAQISAEAECLFRDELEVDRFLKGDLPFPSANTVRRAVGRFYWSGQKNLPELKRSIEEGLASLGGFHQEKRIP